jgi:hypothetical protein
MAVDTAFVMVDDISPTHIQFAWLTPNGNILANPEVQGSTTPGALLSVGRLFFFSFQCFLHPEHPQKAHPAGASDLIGQLV